MANAREKWLEEKQNIDRIVFFSDAVFAIAITLLILQVQIPEATPLGLRLGELLVLLPNIISYIVSFLVIARFWLKHLIFSSYIKQLDQGLIWLNTLLLLSVAFLPFPTGVYGTHSASVIATVFYALSISLTGFIFSILWWHVIKNRSLVKEGIGEEELIKHLQTSLIIPTGFLASAGLALINPFLAPISWAILLLAFRFIRRV